MRQANATSDASRPECAARRPAHRSGTDTPGPTPAAAARPQHDGASASSGRFAAQLGTGVGRLLASVIAETALAPADQTVLVDEVLPEGRREPTELRQLDLL